MLLFDPRGRPTVTADSDHYFRTRNPYVHFQNFKFSTSRKPSNFQVKIVIAIGGDHRWHSWYHFSKLKLDMPGKHYNQIWIWNLDGYKLFVLNTDHLKANTNCKTNSNSKDFAITPRWDNEKKKNKVLQDRSRQWSTRPPTVPAGIDFYLILSFGTDGHSVWN